MRASHTGSPARHVSHFAGWCRRARAALPGPMAVCVLLGMIGQPAEAQQAQVARPPGEPVEHDVRDSVRAEPTASLPVQRLVGGFLDNDLFALRDSGAATDYDYTAGLGVQVQWAEAPRWLRRLLRGAPGCLHEADRATGCLQAALGLRQAIYVPASNRRTEVPGQRPHAGYLGVELGTTHLRPHRTRELQLAFGSTGRPALAEPVQGVVHTLTGTERELGWDNQLEARLLVALRYGESYLVDRRLGGALWRTRAHWSGQVGTLRTSAAAGLQLRVSPDRAGQWMPGDGGQPAPAGPYLFGGLQQERVAHDVFVDGVPGGRATTSVRTPDVWQATVGLGWRFGRGVFEYRHVRRGREYRDQVAPHAFGTLSLLLSRN